ncbi:hypothetical protein SOASR030_12280 [Leminorella grimontii]|uniref:Radical SAM core domain-containing protein n=1 Tax=Leminorella grimontii TaxID=82981 RepID=A0AAV5MZ37_9GAMM|nr:anaerobic sulfatase maturase [Leminorella grimontii]KFC97523.1 Fe-S oxidoreductase/GALNS arylsulfatase regulator [Leminorella grimontii ATCC 33999 = DSM 5078]GKX55116.1 hypothetical protein SOASR030_12280 [Leminorella grimontii]VFS56884.1 Anaerobic sulfatase-maturating enzyme homolog YdeM [Leminorella grimontii]
MHFTIKPTSYQCNIKCDYCFYLEKETVFKHEGWMNDETLSAFISRYIEASPGNDVYFTWQGGEPTMAGIDFFRRALSYQERFKKGKTIHNALQTNGLLLNDEWCRFLKDNQFLVGISIDGPQEMHDRYRRTRAGKGTFDKVMAAIERLKQHGVEFNTLTVVNAHNVQHPLEVYEFLKSIGSRHMQFIELLETAKPNVCFGSLEEKHDVIAFSVPAAAYGRFMSAIFKQWVKNDVGDVFVRQFETFVSRFLGNGHTSCIFQESCKDNMVIESNGDIYECDHFVYDGYKTGNIHRDSLKTMSSVTLSAQKKKLSLECQQCSYRPICHGGCPKHRINRGTDNPISYFCEGYKIMFATMVPYLNAMVELAKNGIPVYQIREIADRIDAAVAQRP